MPDETVVKPPSVAPSPAEPAHEMRGTSVPRPVHVLPPTVWPFVVSVGCGMLCWGLLLTESIAFVGAAVIATGFIGLIGDWVREQRNDTT